MRSFSGIGSKKRIWVTSRSGRGPCLIFYLHHFSRNKNGISMGLNFEKFRFNVHFGEAKMHGKWNRTVNWIRLLSHIPLCVFIFWFKGKREYKVNRIDYKLRHNKSTFYCNLYTINRHFIVIDRSTKNNYLFLGDWFLLYSLEFLKFSEFHSSNPSARE
jgi:hypothetical protein